MYIGDDGRLGTVNTSRRNINEDMGDASDSVEYHKTNAMLLNEVQRQHREIEELKADLATKALSLEDLKASVTELKALVQAQLGK